MHRAGRLQIRSLSGNSSLIPVAVNNKLYAATLS
jgi:hypothetical protein